jgi:hypothetical protein
MDAVVIQAREEKPPIWAMLAPALYLLACAGCVRAVAMDRSIDIGISGLLVAVGLAPAFALPAIFCTRTTRLEASSEGLLVDGRLVKLDDVRVERADRGAARVHVETRGGRRRTFVIGSYAAAQQLMASLPPTSAPAGALAA